MSLQDDKSFAYVFCLYVCVEEKQLKKNVDDLTPKKE